MQPELVRAVLEQLYGDSDMTVITGHDDMLEDVNNLMWKNLCSAVEDNILALLAGKIADLGEYKRRCGEIQGQLSAYANYRKALETTAQQRRDRFSNE